MAVTVPIASSNSSMSSTTLSMPNSIWLRFEGAAEAFIITFVSWPA